MINDGFRPDALRILLDNFRFQNARVFTEAE
jgi:hypothetical protein